VKRSFGHLTARPSRPKLKLKAKSYFERIPLMTVTVKNKTPLVVPPSARRQAGLKSGQKIEFKVVGGAASLMPA
jgi:hypothetical protein